MELEEEEPEEEEPGPPVVDWAEHYRREKKRIFYGIENKDKNKEFPVAAEDNEVS